MDWQQLASLAVVAVTAILLVRSEWCRRQRAKLRACGSDCGCGTSQSLKPLKAASTSEQARKIFEQQLNNRSVLLIPFLRDTSAKVRTLRFPKR